MPHGSGWPSSQARAAGSALMYDVRAQITSESLARENNVEAGALSRLGGGPPGFNAWNSGSVARLNGLFDRALSWLCTADRPGYDWVKSLARSRGVSRSVST